MRAWVSALAGATPCPIRVWSRARSSSERTTMCRLRTSASCSGGIPRPHEHETEPHISQVTTDELLDPFQRSPILALPVCYSGERPGDAHIHPRGCGCCRRKGVIFCGRLDADLGTRPTTARATPTAFLR